MSWAGLDWGRVGLLTLAMVLYGALFKPLGFILATTLFLAAGFMVLGERRPLLVLAVSGGVALGFWAVMSRLLGLYLAPGEVFRGWLW